MVFICATSTALFQAMACIQHSTWAGGPVRRSMCSSWHIRSDLGWYNMSHRWPVPSRRDWRLQHDDASLGNDCRPQPLGKDCCPGQQDRHNLAHLASASILADPRWRRNYVQHKIVAEFTYSCLHLESFLFFFFFFSSFSFFSGKRRKSGLTSSRALLRTDSSPDEGVHFVGECLKE